MKLVLRKIATGAFVFAGLTSAALQASAFTTGYYAIGGAGVGFLNDAEVNNYGEVGDASDLALRLGVGYQWTRYFGIEANYFYYTPVESQIGNSTINASAQSTALLAVAKYPIEKFALFAKAGPSYTWKKNEFDGFGYGAEETESDWDLAYGGGVEYNFTSVLATQVEYLVTDEDTSAATANLIFRF